MAFGSSPGHTFFMSWELWQKMTFVLACGIVFTIFIGLIKLWHTRRKTARYSKVEKGKAAQTPEMLESQSVTVVNTETKEDTPFGIRAIQSGIEVDGVWISRSNTPVGSSRASVVSDRKGLGSYNNSMLELPQAAKLGSSRNSSRAPSSVFERAVSAERIPQDSRSSSPGRNQSSARCSNCNQHVALNPSAAQTLDTPRSAVTSGPPSPGQDQAVTSGHTSNKSSRRTSDESDYMAIPQDTRIDEAVYARPLSHAVAVDPRTDLDLLQSHRMSHVAETGQLTPRVRKPTNSGDWTNVTDDKTQNSNGITYFMPRKTPSPPLASINDTVYDAAVTANEYLAQEEASSSSGNSKHGMPLRESYAPKAVYYPDTYEPRGPQHQNSYDDVPYEVATEQNQRDSQVLRKVNGGFEILKPGTFQPASPEEQDVSEKRQSRKLQKKRRSSEARTSAFIEGV